MSTQPQTGKVMPKNTAVPDSNTLLSYKLLQDSWGGGANVFQGMLQDEMRYLMAGISALNNDPYLQMRLGGNNLTTASQLAELIKSKEAQMDLDTRIEPIAETLLNEKYARPNLIELAPRRRQAVALTVDRTTNVGRLDFKAGRWNNSNIKL